MMARWLKAVFRKEAALALLDRLVLSDAQWARMAPFVSGRSDTRGATGRDNRLFVEAVLWMVRTGAPWRDLLDAFGAWNSVFAGSAAGRQAGCGIGCLRRCRTTRTLST